MASPVGLTLCADPEPDLVSRGLGTGVGRAWVGASGDAGRKMNQGCGDFGDIAMVREFECK